MNKNLDELIEISNKKHAFYYKDNEKMNKYNELMSKIVYAEDQISNKEIMSLLDDNISDWNKLDVLGILKVSRKLTDPKVNNMLDLLKNQKINLQEYMLLYIEI